MKSTFLTLVIACTFICVFSTSCASIFSKSQYPVYINSVPEGAKISILSGRGILVFEGTTPSLVVLDASEGYFQRADYMITLSKPGFFEKQIHLQAQLDGWYLMNLIGGGAIGFLIIDPMTGCMWSIKQKVIKAELLSRQNDYYGNGTTPALKIMALADLDPELKDHLVEIP